MSLLTPMLRSSPLTDWFSDAQRVQGMLDFEAALAHAQAACGMVPPEAVGPIVAACRHEAIDFAALGEAAVGAGNLAIPLVKQLTAQVKAQDPEAARYVHWGATSQDAIDTGLVLQLRGALDAAATLLEQLLAALALQADRYRDTVMPGRPWMPHALPVARRHIVRGSIGAGTGLAVTSMFSHWLLGEVNLWFIAPMGASAVLLFGVPSSPLAQPWSIVGGSVLSALIGVTVGMLVPDAALACGLAAALAIAGMYFLRCLHPPGGAVALTAILGGAGVHSEGYHFVLTPVLLNSLMLALLAIVFNNLVGRRYPHPLAAEEVKSRAVPLGISGTREDIHAALLEGQFLDIDEDDVQELLENIEQQARQRIATAARR